MSRTTQRWGNEENGVQTNYANVAPHIARQSALTANHLS